MSEGCLQTAAVTRADQSGHWDDPLKAHVGQCRDCLEALWVSRSLRLVAEQVVDPRPMPHPALVLLKAEQHRKEAEQRAATRPIRWVSRIAAAGLGVSGAVVLMWKATALGQWLLPGASEYQAIPAAVLMSSWVVLAFVLWGLLQLTLYRFVEE